MRILPVRMTPVLAVAKVAAGNIVQSIVTRAAITAQWMISKTA
jgi:hypothetical protein